MDELISRQALVDAIYAQSDDDGYYVATAESLERLINGLPTVPSEIIRCENCKWSDWYTTAYGEKLCYCMEHDSSGHTVFDFCSYAERKNDG